MNESQAILSLHAVHCKKKSQYVYLRNVTGITHVSKEKPALLFRITAFHPTSNTAL